MAEGKDFITDRRIKNIISGFATISLTSLIFVLYLLTSYANIFAAELKNKNLKDVGEYSEKKYENRDEVRVICGDFRVIAFSDYRIEGKYQDIVRQYFEFTDLKNGNVKMIVASKADVFIGEVYNKLDFDENNKFINNEESFQDGYAYSWACLKGNDANYLVVVYGNGGNCNNCEWVEIMNRNGEVVIRSIKDMATDNHKLYKKKISEIGLGLPQTPPLIPESKHNIKLRKKMLD
jgi:hypothetical protein